MTGTHLHLVTGAGGQVGGVGTRLVEILRRRGEVVKAVVRVDDQRADRLRSLGAEIAVADLTDGAQVHQAIAGANRIYFGMSVSSQYLEATVTMAAAARRNGGLELFVNMSQMSVSEIDLARMTGSPQHRLHWLGEQALGWSGLPVTTLRPTAFQQGPLFMQLAAQSIAADDQLCLPFGDAEVSPVSAEDVAEVAAGVMLDPAKFVGKVLELTGPATWSPADLAKQYEVALGRPITYVDMPLASFEQRLRALPMPEHLKQHLYVMGRMHRENRYRRQTDCIEELLGRPARDLADTVASRREMFSPAPHADGDSGERPLDRSKP